MKTMNTNIAGIKMKNPVMNASGTLGLGFGDCFDLSKCGALVTKGVTLLPRSGNSTPRIAEATSVLLNSIGLENSGVKVFLAEELSVWLSFGVPVIVNISGADLQEYVDLAVALEGHGIAGFEINVSCPNREGVIFGTDPELASNVTDAVHQVTDLPLIVKLTPNVTSIKAVAQAVVEAGADAISAVNTFLGMVIDVKTRRPKLGKGFGGVSGPGIRPLAVKKVREIYEAVNDQVPIIGMGGIDSTEAALEFIIAGASAVAVGTANFTNPRTIPEVIEGLERYLEEQGLESLEEIRGRIIPV